MYTPPVDLVRLPKAGFRCGANVSRHSQDEAPLHNNRIPAFMYTYIVASHKADETGRRAISLGGL